MYADQGRILFTGSDFVFTVRPVQTFEKLASNLSVITKGGAKS